MIEELQNNIKTEIEMLKELSILIRRSEIASLQEKELFDKAISALSRSIKIINRSIPGLVKNISLAAKLPSALKKTDFEKISFQKGSAKIEVALQVKDKEKFLQELSISENLLKRLRKQEKVKEEEIFHEFKAASGYLKLSNKFFLKTSNNLLNKGYSKSLILGLKRANIEIISSTYISMMLFTTFLSIFLGILLMFFFLFFNLGFETPFIILFKGNYLLRFAKVFWLILAVPILTFLSIYFYPATEKSSISKKIDQELPFAVIHMSAISGSGIEPSEIFRIIGLSREYPNLRKEVRKILNQINIYGYDLITALRNIARGTPSQKLAELLNGMATTIGSGGNLQSFFEKRAESLLLSYRLEREKFTRVAETFMDVYISVVIAAPMIFMIILVLISVSKISIGLGIAQLTFLIISVVALINIVFLAFLHVKQPSY